MREWIVIYGFKTREGRVIHTANASVMTSEDASKAVEHMLAFPDMYVYAYMQRVSVG
jgi:hypothetical protein